MADLQAIANAVIKGDRLKVEELTKQANSQNVNPGEILEKGLIAGMSVIGERFKKNEVYVPEVLIAARAMKAGMAVLEPRLQGRRHSSPWARWSWAPSRATCTTSARTWSA